MSPLLLLINRCSRSGKSDLAAAAERLTGHGFAVRRFDPVSAVDAVLVLRRHCEFADVVVIGGGDGTLSRLAETLRRCGRPVGILPLGTANDLARSMRIPPDPVAAADIIVAGHTRRIDLGEVNGVGFFNAANVGLGAQVIEELRPQEKQRWGMFGYGRALRRAWGRVRPFRARVECDGRYWQASLIHLVVGNGRCHGGGITIHEEADPSDGLFHLYAVAPQPWWRLLRVAVWLGRGEVGSEPALLRDRGRRVHVETVPSLVVAADGELITRTPATFRVVPEAVEIFVPAGMSTGNPLAL